MFKNTPKIVMYALALALLCVPLESSVGTRPEPKAAGDQAGLDESARSRVVRQVGRLLVGSYIFPDKAEKVRDHLEGRLEEGAYSEISDRMKFAEMLTADIHSVCEDRHIRVRYDPEGVRRIRASTGLGAEDREKERQARLEREKKDNYGFRKVEILNGNIGYLDLRYFSGLRQAGPTAVAALNFLANCDAVIIDLRNNGGGSPAMIQLLSSYFLEDYTHLNSFEYRGRETLQQFWTLTYVPGPDLYDKDLYILTSSRTFSGAEEFTYNMKNLKRATIVGETTGGGAHPGGSRIVDDEFTIFVPTGRAVNPITGTNWEGVGIEPDVPVNRARALEEARTMALK